ncbi:unnamed protein product [Rotaria sp. Silwood1]|nr:unnamed protein product [Rotaria sp. Silwood1]CAF1573370.1 unnamed protein product [Rotaria sp. Silwood1]
MIYIDYNFVLRKLKYYRMFCFYDNHLITLPLATNNQCSPLERLIINHRCSLNELESLIPYTAELRQLTSHQTDSNITMLQSITLIDLMFIYLHMCKISFYELKTFLVNISSTLKILSIHCSENIIFLDAHRWKQFISYYYPQLEKFYFTYYDLTDNDNQYEIYPGQINQFSSTFWIERKWTFHVKIDNADIKYVVYPYKKTRYDYMDDKNIEHSTSTSLMLAIDLNPFYLEILFERIQRVLTITQIYHLEIIEEYIVPGMLIRLVKQLSDIQETSSCFIQELSIEPVIFVSKKMNSDKSNLYSSPPYNYATIQPTNSFTNPFTSNQSSQLTVDENGNETKPTLIELRVE